MLRKRKWKKIPTFSFLLTIKMKGEKMNENNIYLMDKPIENINEDEFDHKSIVDEIVSNIQNNQPPYNIALIGKWGTGKSSILDCAKKELENGEKHEYLFTMINAWKYEKQEIRKSFILEILDKIPNQSEKNNKIQEIIDSLNRIFMIKPKESGEKEKWYIKFGNIVKQAFICILPLILMFLFAYLIIDIVLNIFGKTINDYNSIRLEQCGAFIMAILTEIGIIIESNVYGKKPVNFYLEENERDTDFYEKQLMKSIELYKEENPDFKSIICVVEDIDRLNANKMVEAISALKGFVGVDNLIFIVPYDTNILCKVLEESKLNKLSNNYEILEGELILNKLFQYKIYMPELIQEDMYEYAKNLIEKENNKICDLFPNKKIIIDDILPILMYEGVTTPREAKQLINSFITKYNIAIRRKVIEFENINREDIKRLAVLTVLENDFNEFYSKIIFYPSIIDEFIKRKKLKEKADEIGKIYEELKTIYNEEKFKSLLMFLNYTNTIKMNNIERLIYLNDSKIDKVSGGKVGKEFRVALTSFDVKMAKKSVEKINNIADMINREISYNSGNLLKKKNIILTLISIYNVVVNDLDKNNIRTIIENHIENLERQDYYKINTIELLKIILDDKEKQCKKIINVFREKIDNWVPAYIYYQEENTDLINEKNIIENEIDMFINSYPNLGKVTQIKIQNLLGKIGNYSLTENDIENDLKLFTFTDYYNFVKSRITEKNYYIIENGFLNKVISCVKEGKIKLEELKVLKDIYVKNKMFDVFANSLITAFIDETATRILECLKILQQDLNKTNIDTKKLIFKIVVENLTDLLKEDNLYDLDSILEKIIIDILKNDNNNDVDALLMKLNEKIYVINTVEKIAINNMLEKIPNTISDINKELIDEENTEYSEMFEKIHNKYSLDEKKDILNKLYQEIPSFKNNIDKIKSIFKILNTRNNREICNDFITDVVNYLETKFSTFTDKKVRNELIAFSTENINLLDKTKKEIFFDFINDKVYLAEINLSVESSSNNNFDDIDDSKWKEIIEKYIGATKLKLMDFINIIDKHNNILMDNVDLKEQVIERVIKEFEPSDEFLNILSKIKIEASNNIIKIYDLFSKYAENPKIIECMKNVLENSANILEIIEEIIKENLDITLLIKISHQSKKIDTEYIIKTIIEKYKSGKENFELKSKIKLLKFIAEGFGSNKKFKNEFVLLSKDIVNNIDSSDINEVIDILINNKKVLDKENRKILINKLEVTIEKTNNKEELIKKIEQLK